MVPNQQKKRLICQSGDSKIYLGLVAILNSKLGKVTSKIGNVSPQTKHNTKLTKAETIIYRLGKGIRILLSSCIENLEIIQKVYHHLNIISIPMETPQ